MRGVDKDGQTDIFGRDMLYPEQMEPHLAVEFYSR
jgi:hypothetical protein